MVTILIKPLLYLMAFGQAAVLFASAIGLACGVLMRSVQASAYWPKAPQLWGFTYAAPTLPPTTIP